MRRINQHSKFFKLLVRLLKLSLLGMFSLVVICVLSIILGVPAIAQVLMNRPGEWLFRLTVLLVSMLVIGIVLESTR